jgi:hypothetical protein
MRSVWGMIRFYSLNFKTFISSNVLSWCVIYTVVNPVLIALLLQARVKLVCESRLAFFGADSG